MKASWTAVLVVIFLVSCDQSFFGFEDSRITERISRPEVSCGEFRYLLSRIGVRSRPIYSSNPFFIEFEDLSTSSGTITSRSWRLLNLRDHMSFPDPVCNALPGCTYTGSSSRTGTGLTFYIDQIATPNNSANNDDFIIELTVTDSQGYTSKSVAYVNTVQDPSNYYLGLFHVSLENQGECQISATYHEEILEAYTGSAIFDVAAFDVDADGSYEEIRSGISLPQLFSHDYVIDGDYQAQIRIEQSPAAPLGIDWEVLSAVEFSFGF